MLLVGVLIHLPVLTWTLGFGPAVPMLDGRIIGGSTTTIEKRPYQLSLQNYGRHICGASVLSSSVALTAAHCTYGITAASLSIRAGSSYREYGGSVKQVGSICPHRYYNAANIDYDVSVLILSSPLQMRSAIKSIRLLDLNEEVPVGAYAVVSGWGTMSEGGSSSLMLQEVTVPRISDRICKQKYDATKITSRMMCFGYSTGGQDACQGDSGGPLVYGRKQAGIVSWGYGCARPEFPGVYTKISDPSIRSHIDQCADDILKPSLWYFDLMRFIDKYSNPRQSTDVLDITAIDNKDDEIDNGNGEVVIECMDESDIENHNLSFSPPATPIFVTDNNGPSTSTSSLKAKRICSSENASPTHSVRRSKKV
ncbi:hypothetical protein FQA39_LY16869 [Lamprigera yunnana]|nr:hypothetical protein FQA39_LY16869 [Lamprigera yunnana]